MTSQNIKKILMKLIEFGRLLIKKFTKALTNFIDKFYKNQWDGT